MANDMSRLGKGSSRRDVLKKAAMGAAAVWAAPMVIGTSEAGAAPATSSGFKKCASAATTAGNTHFCTTCPACETSCGTSPAGNCCCFITSTGCCFCGVSASCLTTGCTKNSDCAPGYLCAYTCCSPAIQCVQTCASANAGGSPRAAAHAGPMQGTR